jgi:hypothetical protein
MQVRICEQQYGFMPNKKRVPRMHYLLRYNEGESVFEDLEKAYDRVSQRKLWYCMRKSGGFDRNSHGL